MNLTFNRRSGLLTSYVGAKDIRGIAAPKDGDVSIHNPWMAYLTDVHHERRFNHFNLVDIYALGGSGIGPFAPLSLILSPDTAQWARDFLASHAERRSLWVAVQVGASDPMKAWRPGLFGQTLAASAARPRRLRLYRYRGRTESHPPCSDDVPAAGGTAPLCDAVGKTSLPPFAAVLSQCRLLLTNDTGPMHLAVGSRHSRDRPVSRTRRFFEKLGHTGPGHWIVQPDLGCAPCGFDKVCFHHACKGPTRA